MKEILLNVDYAAIALILVLCALMALMLYCQLKDDEFDLRELIMRRGHLNLEKLQVSGAWVVSTWGFVYLCIHDHMSEWYFTGYMGAWAILRAVDSRQDDLRQKLGLVPKESKDADSTAGKDGTDGTAGKAG